MVTISELARHWGCRHQHVSRCVKRGCPLDSFESADLWREANTQRSRRVNPAQFDKQIAEEQGDTNLPEDGILIPLATAKAIAFRGYDFILDLVDHLPKNTAAQCNPGNPQIALAVLESECTYILCNACEAYVAWSKVRPASLIRKRELPRHVTGCAENCTRSLLR